ncbi:Fur family transcriptional regulator [Geotoga petraea]|jgi:Fur family ferric uptake transcriptional regulator|uniref:Fur family transcriptional regulator, ferric uptake regulator n=1 Tax=Geotoga petraea TaxID=28234 RepID=A0A1G6MCD3_9BACT|nr:transcriptional repressor [Geotoga petraea]MDK2946584.1 Fur family transcriptional regulator, ferric uptake regulator [Geotoga sp.]TGG87456.1 transcriptional repressor [Geotoga petraea]SDC52605.1 Fur family transcriptional regulator, ferric uptake regulator [Geotoga petraea]
MTHEDILKTTLKNRKQRMTAQRELILKTFMESNGKLMSVDEVFQEIKNKRSQRTSKMTVKRSIDLLVELKLLREIKFENSDTKYEFIRKEDEQDAVMICLRCNKAKNIKIKKKKLMEIINEDISNFRVKNISLKITGYCEDCLTDSIKED